MVNKIKNFILKNKILSVIVLVLVLVLLLFLFIKIINKNNNVSYLTEEVKVGDISTVVTGTGQVEASNTVTLGTNTSGIVSSVLVSAGQKVKKGQLLVSTDSRSAKNALDNAKLSLDKLLKIDSLDLLKSENSLSESYDNGWNKVSSYVTETSDVLIDLNSVYMTDGYLGYKNANSLSGTIREKISTSESSYYKAKNSLDSILKIYKEVNRYSSAGEIKSLIKKSYDSAVLVSKAIKDTEIAVNSVYNYLNDENNNSYIEIKSDVSSWLVSSNNHVNNLLSIYNNIVETEESLVEIKKGADEFDIKSARLNVESKQDDYNDCFVYAPFDGVIATMTARVGEKTSSGVGSIITDKKIVSVYLNEIDIASIRLGQYVTVTFDAIENLSISGEVSEIDSIGTVSSGVVTYGVKIILNENNDSVKSGMSANVSIITNSKKDVLYISASSIKTKGNLSYVEILKEDKTIEKINIEVGISNDTITEVISGLNNGDYIILKTVNSSNSIKSNSSNKSSSPFGGRSGAIPMGGSAMGGMMR